MGKNRCLTLKLKQIGDNQAYYILYCYCIVWYFRCDGLQVGDYITAINGIRTERLKHEEIVTLIKNTASLIQIEITYPLPPRGLLLTLPIIDYAAYLTPEVSVSLYR